MKLQLHYDLIKKNKTLSNYANPIITTSRFDSLLLIGSPKKSHEAIYGNTMKRGYKSRIRINQCAGQRHGS